jgi:transcriptional regulator with XRE-family HTH domain
MASDPTARRVELGILLRQFRQAKELPPKAVEEELGWYAGKLSKVEQGQRKLASAEVDRLVALYGLTGADADRVKRLGQEARKRDATSHVPDWARSFVALERSAAEIMCYDPELVPGLLQTEAFARTILSTSLIVSAEDVDAMVDARVRRKDVLRRDQAPRLWVVLGEAALYRKVGDRQILKEQLRHLRELSKLRHITLQILAFDGGEHVALGTGFIVLRLDDPPATRVYLEGLTDATYLHRPSDIELYTLAFDRLRVAALSDKETAKVLDRRIRELDE